MTAREQLQTVSDVIDAFGGPDEMRAIFGGGRSRFYNHRAAGRFPKDMHMEIYVAAVERGLNIAPELIGMARLARRSKQPLQAAE